MLTMYLQRHLERNLRDRYFVVVLRVLVVLGGRLLFGRLEIVRVVGLLEDASFAELKE